jgi:hypothetical protein
MLTNRGHAAWLGWLDRSSDIEGAESGTNLKKIQKKIETHAGTIPVQRTTVRQGIWSLGVVMDGWAVEICKRSFQVRLDSNSGGPWFTVLHGLHGPVLSGPNSKKSNPSHCWPRGSDPHGTGRDGHGPFRFFYELKKIIIYHNFLIIIFN